MMVENSLPLQKFLQEGCLKQLSQSVDKENEGSGLMRFDRENKDLFLAMIKIYKVIFSALSLSNQNSPIQLNETDTFTPGL